MAIPDFQTLMLPVLRCAAEGEFHISEVVERLAREFQLSEEERTFLLPSGQQPVLNNRAAWAKSYLGKAGLVQFTGRGRFTITDRGREALRQKPERIDTAFLMRYPEFNGQLVSPSGDDGGKSSPPAPSLNGKRRGSGAIAPTSSLPPQPPTEGLTPDETLRKVHDELEEALGREILERVLAAPPAFFERMLMRLLRAMGFGGGDAQRGRALGKSGDDGVDGVIDQDALGLDRVYVQAKRYKPEVTVGPGQIRDFSGSLDVHKAHKGVFVTTSTYTKSALETAEKLSKNIVLIDGAELARLMVRYNVGCRVAETLSLKKLDEDFFE